MFSKISFLVYQDYKIFFDCLGYFSKVINKRFVKMKMVHSIVNGEEPDPSISERRLNKNKNVGNLGTANYDSRKLEVAKASPSFKKRMV